MRKRTKAREYALQLLYCYDVTGESISKFWEEQPEEVEEEVRSFAESITSGVLTYKETIDKKIAAFATNWQLERMAVVDRNILRMGCFELFYLEDVPAKVSINEAVDLAKKYSGEEAGKFVNGILDRIKEDSKKS